MREARRRPIRRNPRSSHSVYEPHTHRQRTYGLPDILLTVELRCTGRQLQERYFAGNLEFLGAVPAGLIEDKDRVRACGYYCSDLLEMKLHGCRCQQPVDERQRVGNVEATTARFIAAAMKPECEICRRYASTGPRLIRQIANRRTSFRSAGSKTRFGKRHS